MFAAKDTLLTRPSGGGYQISRSLRFDSAASAYLNRTPSTTTNRTTWTWSGWVKRASFGSSQVLFGAGPDASNYTIFYFSGTVSENLEIYNYTGAVTTGYAYTTSVFRDPSAWYHVVLAVDTTQGTSADRTKIYVNNVLQPITISTTFGSSVNTWVNTNNSHRLGSTPTTSALYGGYMTEVNFIDGYQYTPSSFGETNADTGVWQPKAYSGSYGTNGFELNFSDNSNTTAATLGKDYSGNGNNFTPNNFSVTAGAGNDSLVDSPTSYGTDTGVGGEVRGNYCTLNPLYINGAGTPAYTNGNLDMLAGGTGDSYFGGTIPVSSGKWYYECLINAVGTGGTSILIGICKTSAPNGVNIGSYRSTSEIYNLDGTAQTAGATYAAGDTIGVAIDIDAGTVKFYKNNTGQGATPSFTFTAGTEVFVRGRSDSANPSATFNFGQRPFLYTAPSGFKALCTQNLPTPTIGATTATTANKFFDVSLWTGNGSSQSITNGGFQPDWVWTKTRSTVQDSRLVDVNRGVSQALFSQLTNVETTESTGITAFNSSGFSVGSGSSNGNGVTYVGWQWKGGGTGVSNTAGSITSTVSANTTSGFSVVTYSGNSTNATVGHGLGIAPSMIFYKPRNQVEDWLVYHVSIGNADALRLNTTAASFGASAWQSTTPTSSVVYLGAGSTAQTGYNNVLYCFAPVAGYSAFGSYTGNGSTNGPFVFTGFRPRFVMMKRYDTSGTNWQMYDTSANPYNVTGNYQTANLSNAEEFYATMDILSNGFKLRNVDGGINGSANTYIFAAFAENPFKYSLAR